MIDVVIPTQLDPTRIYTLIHQIKTGIHQPVESRVVLICSEEEWEASHGQTLLDTLLTPLEKSAIVVHFAKNGIKGNPFNTPEGYTCYPKVLSYMESDHPSEWQYQTSDDDCMTPWALKYLFQASAGKALVMGRAIAVGRNYEDHREYALGESVQRCHVTFSHCLMKTEAIKSFEKPWLNVTTAYGDWELIKKITDHYPYAMIPQIVNVMSLTL